MGHELQEGLQPAFDEYRTIIAMNAPKREMIAVLDRALNRVVVDELTRQEARRIVKERNQALRRSQ